MSRTFTKKSALIGMLLLAGSTGVTAQEMHVAVSKVESGEWFWVAIYSGAVATPYVESVVALRDPATATGDNLRVVQYTRGETWTSQAWTTAEPWEAINWIKDDLGLSETEDNEWGICNDTGVEESVPPVDYTDGMLAEDPWAPIVLALADPASYIELLVDLGYAAADLALENDPLCTSDEVLNGLAGEFESLIASGDITVLSVGAGGVNCDQFAAPRPRPIPPVRPPKPPTAPPWTPPGTPGLPSDPGWTPGGTRPTAWWCNLTPIEGGAFSCLCSRSRLWGRWETTTCGCWPFQYTCIKWHLVTVTETCTNIGLPPILCPPAAGVTVPPFACNTTVTY